MNGRVIPGIFPIMPPMSQSAANATHTITIMPPLCQAPSRSFLLDQRPSLAAAALPISQSASISSTHPRVSQPNHPQKAVNAVRMAAAPAFTESKTFPFSISDPSLSSNRHDFKIKDCPTSVCGRYWSTTLPSSSALRPARVF